MVEKKLMVTESRYFSTEFNTAIIDGPLRIYFSDRQESEALKIYFDIQEILADKGISLGVLAPDKNNMYLMLYPTKKTFKDAFEEEDDLALGLFGDHLVLGVNGPYSQKTRNEIGQRVTGVFVDGIKYHVPTISES